MLIDWCVQSDVVTNSRLQAVFVTNRDVFGHSSTTVGNMWWWHFLLPGLADLKTMIGPRLLEAIMDPIGKELDESGNWDRIFCAVLDVTMMAVLDHSDRWITNNELWCDMQSIRGEPSKLLLSTFPPFFSFRGGRDAVANPVVLAEHLLSR